MYRLPLVFAVPSSCWFTWPSTNQICVSFVF